VVGRESMALAVLLMKQKDESQIIVSDGMHYRDSISNYLYKG